MFQGRFFKLGIGCTRLYQESRLVIDRIMGLLFYLISMQKRQVRTGFFEKKNWRLVRQG